MKKERAVFVRKGIVTGAMILGAVSGILFMKGADSAAKTVAVIGDTEYSSVTDAVEAAKDGDTISLQADAKGDVEVKDKSITLDLNGHGLAGTAPVLTINNGHVVLEDSDPGQVTYYYIDKKGLAHVVDSEDDKDYQNAGSENTGSFTGGYITQDEEALQTRIRERKKMFGINGGGVSVTKGGAFEMKAGVIIGNHSYYSGGGVAVDYESEFSMEGGFIIANKADFTGGGIYGEDLYDKEATITITGGQIRDNISGDDGGGIANYGTMTLNGDVLITANESEGFGGGICNHGQMRIEGKTEITENKASQGGGLSSTAEGSGKVFIGGETNITGNVADNGGGIFNSDKMEICEDVLIKGNEAKEIGGGIVAYRYGDLKICDRVKVEGNKSKNFGDGIFVIHKLTVYGSPAISDKVDILGYTGMIEVTDTFTPAVPISVRIVDEEGAIHSGVFTKGLSGHGDVATCFESADDKYPLIDENGEARLKGDTDMERINFDAVYDDDDDDEDDEEDEDVEEAKETAEPAVADDSEKDKTTEEASTTGSNIGGGSTVLIGLGGGVVGIIVGIFIGFFIRRKKQVVD